MYDGLARRMNKRIGGPVTQFLYDGFNQVQELNGSNGVVANLPAGLGSDQCFARTAGSARAGDGRQDCSPGTLCVPGGSGSFETA